MIKLNQITLMTNTHALKPSRANFCLDGIKSEDLNKNVFFNNFSTCGIFGVVEKQRVKILKSDRPELVQSGKVYELSKILEINERLNSQAEPILAKEMSFEEKFFAAYAGGSYLH